MLFADPEGCARGRACQVVRIGPMCGCSWEVDFQVSQNTMGSVPGHCNNKANSAIKQVTLIIWFPNAYKITFIL